MNRIMIDTETTNSIECPLAYDISWLVFDENYNILEERSYVVYDIYVLEKELMESAYYAEKLPLYEEALANGSKKLARIETIAKIFAKDCKHYDVEAIIAHNALFDYRSCNTTLRYVTKSESRYFFPYGIQIWDTLKMSRQIFQNHTDYYRFCLYYNFMTKTDVPQCTAEVLYRFISNNEEFEEKHIGIDDCKIEIIIFKECMKRNPNCEKSLWKSH